jgi:hypothetical protein
MQQGDPKNSTTLDFIIQGHKCNKWFIAYWLKTSNYQQFRKEMFLEVPKKWIHSSHKHLVNIPQNVGRNKNTYIVL